MENRTDWDKVREQRIVFIACGSVLILFTISLVLFFTWTPVTVHFISIDKGDACLVKAGQGGTVLIDGGDVGSGETLKDFFLNQNVKKLDAVFVSHFHQDHVAGILELLETDYPISRIYISEHPSYSTFENDLLRLSNKKDIPVTRLKESQKVTLGKATYHVISQEPYDGEENFNNMSMILRMDHGASSILFTGDIETDASKRLVAEKKALLDVDVLKVPHHGGASSASGGLVSATSPSYSVISLGIENQYGNPSDITLAYLLRADSIIYRTDREGTVTMTLGKNGIKNVSYKYYWR